MTPGRVVYMCVIVYETTVLSNLPRLSVETCLHLLAPADSLTCLFPIERPLSADTSQVNV